MRLLLFIIAAMFAAQSASAQSLWRNFFTTNRNPIVEVVAGSNATVQASTVGVNLRRFTVNAIPTNAEFVITATLTNQIYASNVVSGGQITVTALASNTPSTSQVLTATSSSSAAWQNQAASGSIDPRFIKEGFEEFLSANLSSSLRSGSLDLYAPNTLVTGIASETNSPGIARLSTGASSSGNPILQRSSGPLFVFAYSNATNEFKLRVNQLPTGAERYTAWAGYCSYLDNEPPTDGAHVFWRTNNSTFLFRAINNGTGTITDTGVTVDTAWHIFKIAINTATNAWLWVDGVYKTNITVNIPTTRPTQLAFGILKSIGTTPATVDIDYIYEAIAPLGGR